MKVGHTFNVGDCLATEPPARHGAAEIGTGRFALAQGFIGFVGVTSEQDLPWHQLREVAVLLLADK